MSVKYDSSLDEGEDAIVEIETVDGKKYLDQDHWPWPISDEDLEKVSFMYVGTF